MSAREEMQTGGMGAGEFELLPWQRVVRLAGLVVAGLGLAVVAAGALAVLLPDAAVFRAPSLALRAAQWAGATVDVLSTCLFLAMAFIGLVCLNLQPQGWVGKPHRQLGAWWVALALITFVTSAGLFVNSIPLYDEASPNAHVMVKVILIVFAAALGLLYALAWPQVHAPRPGYTARWFEVAMTDAMAMLYPAAVVVAASFNTMPYPLVWCVMIGSMLYFGRITGGMRVETSTDRALEAAAPSEPFSFRPTQLQRYGLWIATWLSALGFPLAAVGIAVAARRGWPGLAAWFVPFALGLLGLLFLKGPFLPTPTPLGRSLLKAVVYWILMLLCLGGVALVGKLPAFRFVALLILGIATGLFWSEYYNVSGWRQVTESGFWFRLPPRELPLRRRAGAKPGGAHAG